VERPLQKKKKHSQEIESWLCVVKLSQEAL